MAFATQPLNSCSTLKKCTELYDPEDPSLDDDIDQTNNDVNEPNGASEISDKGKTSDVSPPRGVWLSVTTADRSKDLSQSLKSTQGSGEVKLSTVSSSFVSGLASCTSSQQLTTKTTASVSADLYLGHSMSFLVDLGKEMKSKQKFSAVDIFSCDDKGSSSKNTSTGHDDSLRTTQSDYHLDSLLDTGSLSTPLAVPPIIWKSKRTKPSQIFSAAATKEFVADEDEDLAAEDRMRSLLGAPPIVTGKLTQLSSSVTSPPRFLKPQDDDESADSPPRIIPLDHTDDGVNQPRHIRLSRENSPEEPAEDDLLKSNSSATEPPRIIRLERDDSPKQTPKPIKLCRQDSLTELSDSNQFICHDTPAEPPRMIRLNRDSSPKEEPRIIQLDRKQKPTSDQPKSKTVSKNTAHADQPGRTRKSSKTDSAKQSGYKSGVCYEDNSIGGRNFKGKDKDQKQSSSRISSKDEKKDENSRHYMESTDEKYSSKADERTREKSNRKREHSQDLHQNTTNKSNRRDKSEDGLISESGSERHRRRKKKRQKSVDSNDKHRTKRKKRQKSDDERHDEKHLQDRSYESYHRGSDSAVVRDKYGGKRHNQHESKDRTSDVANSSRASRRSDHERHHTEEVDQRLMESDHDVEVSKSSKHKKHRHSKARTPESGHKHRRGSRSRSRKHKSKTRRRKHKRSHSRSRKQQKSRSASSTRSANSRLKSPAREKHASSPERKRPTKSPDVSDAEDRDISSQRRCSGSRSSRRHSEHNEKCAEEKDNFVPVVSHSSHISAHADGHDSDDRKPSAKPNLGKDMDSERLSLSFLEVCMLTKYGPNFDTSALRHAKQTAKNHSDDSNDIEILGVTYETEIPQSASKKSRRKKRHESGEIDSEADDDHSCCTVEDEGESPSSEKAQLRDDKLVKAKLDIHDIVDVNAKCVDSETKDGKYAQPCMETEVLAKAQVKFEDNVPAASNDDRTSSPVDANLREVSIELRVTYDSSGQDVGISHALEQVLLDNSIQICGKEADNQESAVTILSSSVPKSDHIPGICDDSFVVDSDSKSSPAVAVKLHAVSEKRLPEDFHSISSPEVESERSRDVRGAGSADLLSNYVPAVPLQRTTDTNTASPVIIDCKSGVDCANDRIQTQNDDGTLDDVKSGVSQSEVTPAVEDVSCVKAGEVSVDNLCHYPSTVVSAGTLTSSVADKISSADIFNVKVNESSAFAHYAQDYIGSPKSETGHAAGVNDTCASSINSVAIAASYANASSVCSVSASNTYNASAANSSADPSSVTSAPTSTSSPPKLPPIIQSLFCSSSALSDKTVEDLHRLSRFFQAPASASSSLDGNVTNLSAAAPEDVRTAAAPPPVSGNTMASRLLASLINLSKTAPPVPVAPVPLAVPAEAKPGAIDFSVDDVASPQSDEIMSFSPPTPTRNAAASKEKPKVKHSNATNKALKKMDSKKSQSDASSVSKHEKVPNDIAISCCREVCCLYLLFVKGLVFCLKWLSKL
jgi:hypothetical protein